MGSYYTSCEHCGKEFGARWNWDEDDPDRDHYDQTEPKEITRQRQEHLADTRTLCYEVRALKARVAALEAELRAKPSE